MPTLTRRRVALPAAGLLAVAVAAGVGLTLTDDDPAPTAAGRTLALTSPGGGGAAGSCAVPDAAALAAGDPVAFEGTATSVTTSRVTLDVQRWFANRPDGVTRVELANPGGSDAVALDGIAFTTGRSYLVSAADGTVRICGLSGESSPELLALFTAAFPNGG